MAKRRNQRRNIQNRRNVQPQNGRTASDGFINTLAHLGDASELQRNNDYVRNSITRNYELLTTMYRENWLAKRIIDTPCEDMTRSWYTLASSVEQQKLDELAKLESKHSVKQEITNALRWSRLYGGAAAVIVIKGQEDMLDQPLDYDELVPGCFRGLIVVDRSDGLYPSLELEEDMDDPEFGYPRTYTVTLDAMQNKTMKIHHSRLLLFRGRMLPPQEEIAEEYWGTSELEHVYDELQKRDATSANIAQLIFQANVATLKIGDYGEVLGMGTERQKQQIQEAIAFQNRVRNSFGMWIMGNEDAYEQHPYSFAGLSEVYESFMLDMAGAAEIPATKLYGRAPQGMNATGESDMKNYYEMLAQLQERHLRPAIEKLLPIMAISLWGSVPDDMEVVFEPLMTTTPTERAAIMQQITGTVVQAYSAGLVTQRGALLELQKNGKDIGVWDIDEETLEKADNEFDSGEMMEDPMSAMMGGMMPESGQEQPEEPEDAPAESDEEMVNQILSESGKPENGEDGGPGSGPKPGYKKNGTSKANLLERAKFIANPVADLPEPKKSSSGINGSKSHVEQMNRERKQWSDLTTHQKVQGNAEQQKHIAKMKRQVIAAAAKGDLDKAKAIVKANRHYWANDPDSAQKVQSETLKRQRAVKPRGGFLHDALTIFAQIFGRDAREFKESEHPRGKSGKGNSGSFAPVEKGSSEGRSSGSESSMTGFQTAKELNGQQRVEARKIAESIALGKATLDLEQLNKHVQGTPEYLRHCETLKRKKRTPSYFTEDYESVKQEILSKICNKNTTFKLLPNGVTYCKITLDRAIGRTFGANGTEGRETNVVRVCAQRSRHGQVKWHMFPDD